jgi:hypothetical protein
MITIKNKKNGQAYCHKIRQQLKQLIMSEKDNKENQEEKPMDTIQMLLGLATFAVSIYLLYVVFVG